MVIDNLLLEQNLRYSTCVGFHSTKLHLKTIKIINIVYKIFHHRLVKLYYKQSRMKGNSKRKLDKKIKTLKESLINITVSIFLDDGWEGRIDEVIEKFKVNNNTEFKEDMEYFKNRICANLNIPRNFIG